MITTEKVNSSEFEGVLVFFNGELVARIEVSRLTDKLNCYVYSDSTDEDYTDKIEIK